MRLKKFEEYENINEEVNLNFLNPKNWKKDKESNSQSIDPMLNKLFTYIKNNFSYNFLNIDRFSNGHHPEDYYEYKTDGPTIKLLRYGTHLSIDGEKINPNFYSSKIYNKILNFLIKKEEEKEELEQDTELTNNFNKIKDKYSSYFDKE